MRPRQASGRLFDDVVGQVQDYAIIALDPQGTIETWNLGAERVKGYTADEAIGRSFAMFYTEEDRRSGLPLSLLLAARDEGRIEHLGWRVRKDGTRFWGDVVITARHDAQGNHTGYTKVTRDLTEQHDLELRLRASEERLRLLVGQVQDYAIIALDPQGVVETWNLGAERVKGYTADEAIGRSFAMFYTDADRRSGLPLRLLAEAREKGRVEHTGWRVRKDGTRFWGDVVITAMHDDSGRLTGYAKVTRDRTDVKALEDAQDTFYAAFLHDFRTPVSAMLSYIDAIRDATDEERTHFLERVETNALRLSDMVEGLVDFAKQRAAHSSLLMDDLDVTSIAHQAVHDLTPLLDPSRVEVVGERALGHVNEAALHRVLTNLMVNSLRYSPPGSPVQVRCCHEGQDRVEIRVVDHGRGIDPGDVDTIFEEFNRGRLAQDDGGTGLGLASVRELVTQMRGTVRIESEVGVGTTVVVDLPAGRVHPPRWRRSATTPEPGPPRSDVLRVDAGLEADGPLGWVVVGVRLHLLAQLLAGAVADPVAEDAPLGVVGLVLQAPREQAVPLVGDVAALEVLAADPGVVGARALHERPREGQAPLVALVEPSVGALRELDDGVADDPPVHDAVVVGAVVDEDREVDTDLAGGEPDAVGGVHRGDHVGGERAQLVVVRRDGAGRTVHHGLAPARHRPHGAALGQLDRVGGEAGRGHVRHVRIVEARAHRPT